MRGLARFTYAPFKRTPFLAREVSSFFLDEKTLGVSSLDNEKNSLICLL